jgi:ferric-dicitrate binding protein FerR (iron transport regulator)
MSSRPEQVDWERLDRYLAGRGSAEELAELAEWVATHPQLQTIVDAVQAFGKPSRGTSDADAVAWDTPLAWDKMRRRLSEPPVLRLESAPAAMPSRGIRRSAGRRRLLPIAAAAAVAVFLVRSIWSAGIGHALHSTPWSVRSDSAPMMMRLVSTGRGQMASIELSDGSKVTLAQDSRLRIPAAYGARSAKHPVRELYLEGKALFRVRHDSLRPFLVHTSTALAEDLGTEFVVASYPEMRATQVFVSLGSVAIRPPSALDKGEPSAPASGAYPLAILRPGMLARIEASAITTVTPNVPAAPYLGWTQGRLVLDGTPMRETVAELSRWYNADIHVDASLENTRVTAELTDEPLDAAVHRLASMLGARAIRRGRTVTFTTNGGAKP